MLDGYLLRRERGDAGRLRALAQLALVLFVLVFVGFNAGPASAAPPKPPSLKAVQFGLQNHYRLGFWAPVTVTFQGGDERVTGIVELSSADGDGVPVVYRSSPMQILPGQAASTTVYVRPGSPSELGVVLRSGSDVVLSGKVEEAGYDGGPVLPGEINPNDRLIVSVGPNPTLAELRFRDPERGSDVAPELARFEGVDELPTKAIGYDAVDCVVLRADRQERYARLPADAPQWSALRTWVEQGGKLVIIAGSDVERLMTGNGPLGRLFPVTAEGMAPLPRTAKLEEVGKQPLNLDAETLAELRVLRIRETDGDVELAEGNLPLVIRRAVGFGRVTFAAVDLEHKALADWSPRQKLIRQLIDNVDPYSRSDESASFSGSYGYTDIAGQLRSGLDQYQGVQVISFFTLAVLVLGYIALVGPGDFLLVKKVLRRTELTWITLPTIVVLTTVGAHYLAVWMKGKELRTNQVDVVDCDAKSGVIRGLSYAGVFSPATTQYDVAWQPSDQLLGSAPKDFELIASWLGMPGKGLGGMHRRDVSSDWLTRPYRSADNLASLDEMPIQVWSSKVVTGRYRARTPKPLHGPLSRRGDRLLGTVENPFGCTLVDAWVYHDTNAYQLRDLKPGQTVDLKSLSPEGLRSRLTDTYVETVGQYQAPRYRSQVYDTGSREVAKTVRQMMFFETAGGLGHTSLVNRYQPFLDAGELLALNRAILVASVKPDEVDRFGTRLSLESGGAPAPRNHDTRTVFVRLVIPVESAAP